MQANIPTSQAPQIQRLKRYLALRNKARRDTFWLAGILGYELAYKHNKPFHHQALNNITTNQFSFTEIARGFWKTTLYTITLSIQDIINDPNIRIFIGSWTGINARAMLSEIANHFVTATHLRLLFPHVCPNTTRQTGTWNEDSIVVKRTIQWKEGTVEAGGADQNPVSKHFDKIRMDDLVVWQNTRTVDQIEKTKIYISKLPPLLNMHRDDSTLSFLGTSWEPDDPYQDMKRGKLLAPDGKPYHIHRTPAEYTVQHKQRVTNPTTNEVEEVIIKEERIPTFPQFFPLEKLDGLKSSNRRSYEAFYLLDPNDTEDSIWTQKDILEYDILPPHINLTIYGGVDPAISERDVRKNSDTAVVILGIDQYNDLWWLDYHTSKGVEKIIPTFFSYYEKWRTRQEGTQVFTFRMFSVETVAFQKLIYRDLMLAMNERQIWIPVRPDTPYTDKTARIMILDPLFKNHKVHIRHDMEQLRTQILRFGKPATKVDILDAGAQAYKSSQIRLTATHSKDKNIYDKSRRYIRGALYSTG